MPRFAANISLMYPEFPLLERIAAAARDGFAAVEVQSPYEVSAAEFRRALDDAKVELVLLNAPAGNAAAGERGLAALPGRELEFEESIALALDYALTVNAPRVHVMAGVATAFSPSLSSSQTPANDEALPVYLRNLSYACDKLHPHGVRVMIEPINTRDIPGYYLNRQQQAADIIAALLKNNLALQMDFYHLQLMEGDLTHHLERHFPIIGHLQIAAAPQRNEPDTGEIHYPTLFRLIDALGYRGWVGCEYRPLRGAEPGGTSAGLAWLRNI